MEYTLKDLLDIPKLRVLLDSLDEIHSKPSAIIDTDGNILTATAWQDICTKFHRINPETKKQCIESDTHIKAELDGTMAHVVYRCPMGLVDTATPIVIEAKHLGNVFTGQLFLEPPDEAYFVDQAHRYGFDETEYLAAVRKVPFYTEQQLHSNLTFMHGLAQMLAEQGLKTKRLIESEERHRTILQTSMDGVWIIDMLGHFIEVNEAYCRMSGYSEQELLTMFISDVENIERHEDTIAHLEELKALGNVRFLSQHRRKDGSLFDVEITAQSYNVDDVSYVAFVRDITEQKKAELELKKSEEKTRLILDSAAEAIYGLDSFGQCTFCNRSCLNILGYRSEEELLGRNMHDVIHHTTMEGLPNPVKNCQVFKSFQHGEKIHIEMTHLWKADGTSFSAEVWSHPIRKDDAIIGAVVTFNDITKQKQSDDKRLKLENQLRQSQKMEAIGTMAGGIAHDFNNLLAIIGGNLELLRLKQQSGRPFDENLEHITEATTRAINLVAQILAFSRQEQKDLVLVNLSTFVGESLKFLRPMIPSTVEVVTEIPEDHVFINANTTQLQQVLINLCTNALHAMNEKGLLRIGLEEVGLASQEVFLADEPQASRYAKLSVVDSGKGMDKKTLDQIFDPFFTTKEVGGGTGMGLSMVHGIIEQHRGFIHVDSTLGQGTTFTMYFPVTSDVETPERLVVETDLPTGTEYILFVDDEQYVADVCGSMLEHLGYKVTIMTNSVEALNLFKAHSDEFDLVITDQTMPKMSGVELAKEILSIRPKIPVVLCSGYSSKESEEAAKNVGISAFCMKPMEMKQLASVVREVLDSSV